MRQKYFDTTFAQNGDKTTVPDPTQGSGSLSFNIGYGPDYDLNLATNPSALSVDRAMFNYLLNTITAQLQQYQQYGAPEWITSTNNGGSAFAYDFGAVVRYSASGNPPFITYVSIQAGASTNTDTPGTGSTNWLDLSAFESALTYCGAAGGTTNAWTGSVPIAPATLPDGFFVRVKLSATNSSTTPTFNLNSIGAATIYSPTGSALLLGSMPEYANLQWSTALSGWVLMNFYGVWPNGATVTNPMSTSETLTINSTQLQTFSANAYGLVWNSPAANTMNLLGGPTFIYKNIGKIPTAILDGSGNYVAWSMPGTVLQQYLENIGSTAGKWRFSSGNQCADATGLYLSQSIGAPSNVTSLNISVSQLSAQNGILFSNSLTGVYGWSENETGKQCGALNSFSLFATASYVSTIPLTATTALLLYRAVTTGYLTCVVATLNTSTLAVTLGTPEPISTTDTPNTAASNTFRAQWMAALSPSLVLCVYATSSGTINACTISISGTSATPNAVVSSSVTTTGTGAVTAVALSATLGNTVYYDSSGGISSMRISVSGTTPTFGTPIVIKASPYTMFNCWAISTTQLAVVYQEISNVTPTNGNVITDSGTAISIGTEQVGLLYSLNLGIGYGNTCGAVIPSFGVKGYAMAYPVASGAPNRIIRFSVSSGIVIVDQNQQITPGVPYCGALIETFPFSGGGVFQLPLVGSAFTNGDFLPQTAYMTNT